MTDSGRRAGRFARVPPRDGLSVIRDLRFLVSRSLELDMRTVRLAAWPLRSRAALVTSKYVAVVRLVGGAGARLSIGGVQFTTRELVDVGTLQAAFADTHDLLAPVRAVLPDRPVVVDVGAHRGEFLFAVKQLFPRASVLSFEPDPAVHVDLAANAAGWPDVTTRCVALGDRTASMVLYRAPLSVMSSLRPPSQAPGEQPLEQVEVPVVTLDDACAELDHIDVLKVDVEGFEDAVVAGARDVIRRSRFLLVELGLTRGGASNLDVLSTVHDFCPTARIIAIGRPLGSTTSTMCQDVLVDLAPAPPDRDHPA